MPAFSVLSSIEINAPTATVRDTVSDFNTWPTWSPWLMMEPDCKLTYKGNAGELGHGYDWEGTKVGAGGMTTTALDANRMEMDLQFLKPWKSKADIAFDFESVGDNKTQVKWHMDSSLPFFMFFMLGKMKAMIGNDYDRGLRMLKDHIETGVIASNTKIEGIVDVPAALYVGKKASTTMDEVGDSMEQAFTDVHKYVTNMNADINDMPFSIYNNMDMVKRSFEYTAAIPIASAVSVDAELADGLISKERAACKALKVVHTGSYKHLGNAWSAGMQDMQHFKHKADKQNPPFEIYRSEPENTPDDKLITEIYIPVRG